MQGSRSPALRPRINIGPVPQQQRADIRVAIPRGVMQGGVPAPVSQIHPATDQFLDFLVFPVLRRVPYAPLELHLVQGLADPGRMRVLAAVHCFVCCC